MLQLWYLILGGFMSATVVVGNAAVIYLIITRSRLHTTANWFVLSLAMADFSVGAGYLLTEYLCDVHSCERLLVGHAIVSFIYAASVSNLCLMILDRYIAIVRPLSYVPLMTTRRVALLISFAWLVAFLPHFILLLKSTIFPENQDIRIFMIFDMVVFETLPVIILLLATGRIFLIARRHSRQSAVLTAQLRFNQRIENITSPAQRRQNSSAKLVGIAVAVFVICYGYELYYTVLYEISAKTRNRLLFSVNNLLFLLNSAVNPIAYAFFKSDIKSTLRKLLPYRDRH